MRDKHENPVEVGDLVISTYHSSIGQIYRIKAIEDSDPLATKLMGSNQHASCVRVYDQFLEPQNRGNFTTWGRDIIKVDKQYVTRMHNRWEALAQELTDPFSKVS